MDWFNDLPRKAKIALPIILVAVTVLEYVANMDKPDVGDYPREE